MLAEYPILASKSIVRAGIITDDKPSCIDLSVRAERVKHASEEEIAVRVEEIA